MGTCICGRAVVAATNASRQSWNCMVVGVLFGLRGGMRIFFNEVGLCLVFALCPQMCDAGIENPKKNVWLNKSIYPLNKTFLLGKKAKKMNTRDKTQSSFWGASVFNLKFFPSFLQTY